MSVIIRQNLENINKANMQTKIKASDISLKADPAKEKRICKAWPTVKIFLTDIQGVIKNPIAAMIFAMAAASAETIVNLICAAKAK